MSRKIKIALSTALILALATPLLIRARPESAKHVEQIDLAPPKPTYNTYYNETNLW